MPPLPVRTAVTLRLSCPIPATIPTAYQEDDAPFVLETSELLEVNLRQPVWAKLGSMIAYTGQVRFERESVFEGGMKKFFKKKLTGEGTPLMKMEGQGSVYLADHRKKITLLRLEGESLSVNGNDLLAMEPGIDWDIELLRGGGMTAGGLFNVKLSGHGMVAITSHGKPLTLEVQPGRDVFTDPDATVAWAGTLTPQVKMDASLKTFIGRGSGETFQLRFSGSGWVVVQPSEEVPMQMGEEGGGGSSSGQNLLDQFLGG